MSSSARATLLALLAAGSTLAGATLAGCSLPGAQTNAMARSTTAVSPGSESPTPTAIPTPTPTPSSSSAIPSSATPSPSTPSWPEGRTLTVVGLGDSVMSAPGCGCDGPVAEYGKALQTLTHLPVTASDEGESGLTASGLAQQLAQDAGLRQRLARADVVLVTIGANDLAPLAQRWQNCQAACWNPVVAQMGKDLDTVLDEVEKTRSGHPTQVLVSNYWNVLQDGTPADESLGTRQVSWSRELTSAANEEIASVTGAHQAALVDLVEPFLGADGNGDPTAKLLADGDHPNAAGVAAMARAFLSATRPATGTH